VVVDGVMVTLQLSASAPGLPSATSASFVVQPDVPLVNGAQIAQINSWAGYSGTWTRCFKLGLVPSGTSSSASYHLNCDGRGASFFVARTPGGQLIGGYRSLPISSASGYKSDLAAFLFSLTNSFKHSLTGSYDRNAVYEDSTYGPTFGAGHDFTFQSRGFYCNLGFSYTCRTGSVGTAACAIDFCGTWFNGSNYQNLPDLEVYTQY
jgi:hypothetical protein